VLRWRLEKVACLLVLLVLLEKVAGVVKRIWKGGCGCGVHEGVRVVK
jgi:hypothetical protein